MRKSGMPGGDSAMACAVGSTNPAARSVTRRGRSRGEASAGSRSLNFTDRVVQRSVANVLQPLVDGLFVPESFGFRPRLGRTPTRWPPVRATLASGRDVVLAVDIRDAFGSVPQQRLLQILAKYVPAPPDFLELVRRIVTDVARHRPPAGRTPADPPEPEPPPLPRSAPPEAAPWTVVRAVRRRHRRLRPHRRRSCRGGARDPGSASPGRLRPQSREVTLSTT